MQHKTPTAGAATPARTPGLADLRAFIIAAELRSFAAAAKALHLSLPAFSRRISNLEARLGARLFDRTTRSMELTLLGAKFLREITPVIEDLDRSVFGLRDAAQLEAGDVTIACVFSAVHDFRINYIGMQEPDVDFTPLLKDPYVLACRADHALGTRRSVRWQELAAWDQV